MHFSVLLALIVVKIQCPKISCFNKGKLHMQTYRIKSTYRVLSMNQCSCLISPCISQFSTVISHGDVVGTDYTSNKQSAANWWHAYAMPSASLLNAARGHY